MDDENILAKIAKLEEKVSHLEGRTDIMNDLLIKVTSLCDKVDNLIKIQENLSERLSELEKQPADKWALVTKTVITVAVTAAVTYLGSRFMK